MTKRMTSGVAVAFVLVTMLVACGGGSKIKTEDDKSVTEYIPEWYTNIPDDPEFIYAARRAPSPDLDIALSSAAQLCRNDILLKLQNETRAKTDNFIKQIGAGDNVEVTRRFQEVNETVAAQALYGVQVVKREPVKRKDGGYYGYVLMKMPVGVLLEQLLEEMKRRENLLTDLNAEKALLDLREEVARLKKASY